MPRLKRELSLFTATLYGVGIILGAGIYALIGQAAGIAGDMMWLSFVVAAFIAAFTGLSYAELAGMFPRDAAEYVYMKKAFSRNFLSFIVQWIMLFTLIVSASTVAMGFGGYFSYVFGVQPVYAAAGLLAVLSVVNYIGIKSSTKFAVLSTLVEMSGLAIIIAIGIFFFGRADTNFFYTPGGFGSVLSATALIFFAYIGFEELVNMSEETKNASKVIPKALLIALAISTILYILVAVSALSVVGAEGLANSDAPLTEVAAAAIPQAGLLLSFIALFATANTVLVTLIVVSRMLYGLSCNNTFPSAFRRIGGRGTPYMSVLATMIFSILFLSIGGIGTIASLTDVGVFIVYLFVNSSLIALRYKEPNAKRQFKSPVNIGKFPVLAFLGICSSFLMLLHFDPMLIVYEIIVVIAGFIIYKAFTKVQHIHEREKMYARYFRKSIFTIMEMQQFHGSVSFPLKVSDIMIKNVKVVQLDDRAMRAIRVMNKYNIGSVLVADKWKVVGIITEWDFIERVLSKKKNPEKILCKDVMSKPVITIEADRPVKEAIDIMARKSIKKLPVVRKKILVGLITAMDILQSGKPIPYNSLKKLGKFYPVRKYK